MEEHRERLARRRRRRRAVRPSSRGRRLRAEFVGYEQTEVLTAIRALEPLEDGRFLAKLARVAVLPGGRRPGLRRRLHRARGDRRARRARRGDRFGDDQVLVFEGEGFAAGDRVRAVVPWAVRFPTMANHTATHLLHKALREVLGEHVHAGGLGRPAGQAPLRLHARAGADDGGARARSSAGSTRRSSRTARCARS